MWSKYITTNGLKLLNNKPMTVYMNDDAFHMDFATVYTMSLSLFIFILLCAAVLNAAKHSAQIEPRLIGGHEANPYSHPYMVSLQRRFLWLRLHVCGGAIIKENWILTAAHCTSGSFLTKWLPLDAIAGIHNNYFFGSKAQIRTIMRQIRHPGYNGGIDSDDIAVLKTYSPFKFTREVQPINLPQNLKFDQQKLTLPGWGVLKTSIFMLDFPEKLQEVEVTYLPYDDCFQAVEEVKDDDEFNPLDENSNICTGPITGGIAACSGDSGGPLVLNINNNEPAKNTKENDDSDVVSVDTDDGNLTSVVFGIVSWGMSPCGDIGAPTVYTKVSAYLDFINKHVNK